jgi:hypothetical protein
VEQVKKIQTIRSGEVKIGDTIRIEYEYGDIKRSIEGRVRNRSRYTHSTEFTTERGYVLLTVFRSNETEPKNIKRIVLIERRDADAVSLPGLDELMAEVAQ